MVLGILALHVLPFATRPAIIGGDEPHYALLASSIATDGDFALDEDYLRVEAGSNAAGVRFAGRSIDRHLRSVNGRLVFQHPIGLPVIAAPLLALTAVVAPKAAPDIPLGFLTLSVSFAALFVSWRLVSDLLESSRDAALLVFCVYFGSPLWFYSRTFFTEPYTWAFAVFAIAGVRTKRVGIATTFLALVLAMKETGVLLVIAILVAGHVNP